MTRGERTWLFVGLLGGLAATLAVFAVMHRTPAAGPIPMDEARQEPQVASAPPEGPLPVVQLTTGEQERIGLQTTEVRRGAVYGEIVAPARVEELDSTVRTITAGVAGRIDRLLLSVDQSVQKGQPVALIHSPELVRSAEEYRSAVESRRTLAASPQAGAVARADELVEATRRRLDPWGLSPDAIRSIVASPQAPIHATIRAESSGIVRVTHVSEGRVVSAGEGLFTLIDLSTVGVRADVFQSEIGRIRPGLKALIISDALPGVTLRAEVDSIDPQSDFQTGTTPVRLRVANPGMRLMPGMLARSVFQASLGTNVLAVPRTAVIDTGTDKIVYVASDGGVFQRRSIQVGPPGKDDYPVLGGLVEGDKVVTNGAFLIDSQARLTSGMTALFGDSRSFSESPAPSGPAAQDSYSVTFRTDPEPPAAGEDNSAQVTVLDSSGTPVNDARVRVTVVMPAMPSMGMPEMRHSADLPWRGSEYAGPMNVGMPGSWNVVVEARRGNQLLATYRTRFDAR
jgi:RND family efflux transporter MFP subunit